MMDDDNNNNSDDENVPPLDKKKDGRLARYHKGTRVFGESWSHAFFRDVKYV